MVKLPIWHSQIVLLTVQVDLRFRSKGLLTRSFQQTRVTSKGNVLVLYYSQPRPFWSCSNPLLQTRRANAKLYENVIQTNFHKKDFALGLVLKVKIFGTRKWPITDSETKNETKKKAYQELQELVEPVKWLHSLSEQW